MGTHRRTTPRGSGSAPLPIWGSCPQSRLPTTGRAEGEHHGGTARDVFFPRAALALPLTSANVVKSLLSLFLEPLTTCDFSIVRQETLMRLFAPELLSPPWMASELLWPVCAVTAAGGPGPHLPGCPTVAKAKAEGDKLLGGAASMVVTLRSPSTVPNRQWGDKCVPTPLRDLKAKLTQAMETQNLEGETRPQHYGPCPPSCPVPRFPQRNKILLGCPPWSSTKGLDQGMHQHWAQALPASRPWQRCPLLSFTPTAPSMGSCGSPAHF